MKTPLPHIARLAPLLPELSITLRLSHGEIPQVLRAAGSYGERHLAALISLAVAGPATVSELGKRLAITPAHASLVVRDLAKADLVAREHDPADRRRIVVTISQTAKPAVAEMRKRRAAPLGRFLAQLSDREADEFIVNVERLIASLQDCRPGVHDGPA